MKWLLTATRGGDAIARYVQWLRREGIASCLIGSTVDVPEDPGPYSALLLTGGGDVNPDRYGQRRHPKTKNIDDERDDLEIRLIRRFLKMRKPIFGVCRGIQILNVALGGKLVQHVPELPAVQVRDEGHTKVGGIDSRHALEFRGRSKLRDVLRRSRQVNSAHHQAVDPDAVGRGLRVVAVSPAGVIEAVEGRGLPGVVVAVQWHPERLGRADPASGRLIELMMDLCAR